MYGFRVEPDSAAPAGTPLRFGGLAVSHAETIPAVRLQSRAGDVFGVVLGWPIDGAGWRLIEEPLVFDAVPADADAFHAAHLEPLRGSWLAIVAAGGKRRAWLDPFGSLSLVFDPAARRAGGTASDILGEAEYGDRLDRDLRAALGVEKDGWFTAGLTAHRGVERLLVNHALDLDTFVQERVGWFAEAPAGSGEVAAHLDTLAREMRGVAAALAATGRPLAMGLTGGADSRMMLAALREQAGDILFYTVAAPGSAFDLDRAREIADRFGLEHRTLPLRPASEAQAAEWDRRVGHAVQTANRTMFPSVAPLAGHACLGGLGGEVGRCFLWGKQVRVPDAIDPLWLTDALKLPRLPPVVDRIAGWLAALPERDPVRVLDLAYIELRMGPWAFAQSYSNPASFVLHPMGSAASLRAMLSLPATYRQGDGMIAGMIERFWPELLALPINRYGDWRDLKRQALRLARPDRVFRKLRQLARTR